MKRTTIKQKQKKQLLWRSTEVTRLPDPIDIWHSHFTWLFNNIWPSWFSLLLETISALSFHSRTLLANLPPLWLLLLNLLCHLLLSYPSPKGWSPSEGGFTPPAFLLALPSRAWGSCAFSHLYIQSVINSHLSLEVQTHKFNCMLSSCIRNLSGSSKSLCPTLNSKHTSPNSRL